MLGLSQISSKSCPKYFWNIPNILLIMLFQLPIMLVLCFNINNIYVKILLLECSIRVLTIRAYVCFILSINSSAF